MLKYFGGVVNVGKKERLGERVSEQRLGQKKRVALRKALFFHNNKKNFQLH